MGQKEGVVNLAALGAEFAVEDMRVGGLIGRRLTREKLATDPTGSIWRYKPLLPVGPDAAVPPLTVGWTPLYRANRLAADLGC